MLVFFVVHKTDVHVYMALFVRLLVVLLVRLMFLYVVLLAADGCQLPWERAADACSGAQPGASEAGPSGVCLIHGRTIGTLWLHSLFPIQVCSAGIG